MHSIFSPFSEIVFMMKHWICSIKFDIDNLGKKCKRMNDPLGHIRVAQCVHMHTLGPAEAVTSLKQGDGFAFPLLYFLSHSRYFTPLQAL